MNLHRVHQLLAIIAAVGVTAVSSSHASGRLDQSLESLVRSATSADSAVQILVILDNSQAQQSINRLALQADLSRSERIKQITARLKAEVPAGSAAVQAFLQKSSSTRVVRHWVIPAFTATIPVSELNAVANLPGVDQVLADIRIELTTPVDIQPAPALSTSASADLQLLNVPALWQKGLSGKGRLICSFDTGVEGTHPALSAKWRGNHAPLHSAWFSQTAPDSLPFDKSGHGTHTMGIMLGSTATDSFGVAPDAEWICAAVVDQGPDITTTISYILEAFQWALDPDGNPATTDDVPDVILNSWGLPTLQPSSMAPCSTIFWQAIDNVEAAGIVAIFAAGNEGKYGAQTIRNPANRATTPYNSFCVGAVSSDKVIADFSSRGPSSCDTTQIKPELVAPGVGIRSSYRGGTYVTMSGTSMAAPFIAGLVALCRQYNPDATVDQIKYALMHAAQDLGPAGEDNDYGWGLVDAAQILKYLPAPSSVRLSVVNKVIDGDGVGLPGETFGLQIYLASAAGNIDQVIGQLTSLDDTAASIGVNRSAFIFGTGGTLAVNAVPFQISLSPSLVHGTLVPFKLTFYTSNGVPVDSTTFRLTAGYPIPGSIMTHHTGAIDFTVSDFGQFGLGQGSIYNVGGAGFRYNGSSNLLYEAGLIIGRSSVQLSNSIRDSLGQLKLSDFRPRPSASSWIATDGSSHLTAILSDNASPLPIPVTLTQESIHFSEVSDNAFVIVKYQIINSSLERLSGLYAGVLADFDLSASDSIEFEPALDLMYQASTGSGPLVGLVTLKGTANFTALNNGPGKAGFSRQQQYTLISSGVNYPDASARGDKMLLLHTGPYSIAPQGTIDIAFAFVAGANLAELEANAVRAKERYGTVTSVDDNLGLPNSFELRQNYPNPFNPSTSISFTLPAASQVSLDIYNMLGQQVTQLCGGLLGAGTHRLTWNGTDSQGNAAAAGVYFYRLTARGTSLTRKMVLLK